MELKQNNASSIDFDMVYHFKGLTLDDIHTFFSACYYSSMHLSSKKYPEFVVKFFVDQSRNFDTVLEENGSYAVGSDFFN